MRRAVRMRAPVTAESETLRQVLAFDPLNLQLWRNTRGCYQDRRGQWITYGVGPNGASDTIGYRVIRVTPAHVGKRLAQFCAFEVKRAGETLNDKQEAFIGNINAAGGVAAGVWGLDDLARALELIP